MRPVPTLWLPSSMRYSLQQEGRIFPSAHFMQSPVTWQSAVTNAHRCCIRHRCTVSGHSHQGKAAGAGAGGERLPARCFAVLAAADAARVKSGGAPRGAAVGAAGRQLLHLRQAWGLKVGGGTSSLVSTVTLPTHQLPGCVWQSGLLKSDWSYFQQQQREVRQQSRRACEMQRPSARFRAHSAA